MLVVDISDPAAPTQIYQYPFYANDVWLADDGYVYIASGVNGGLVFKPYDIQFPRGQY